jgi:hypothetical protein
MTTEQERLQELVRQMYESAEDAPWELSPEDIRAQRRRRFMPMPDPKAIVLVAVAVGVIIAGFFLFGRPTSHTSAVSSSTTTTTRPSTTTTTIESKGVVTVPNLVGLTQAHAEEVLRSVGLTRGKIAGVTDDPAGVVVTTDPSAGASVAQGTAVDLMIAAGPNGLGIPSSTTATPSTTVPPPSTSIPTTASTVPTTAATAPTTASTVPPAQSDCASGNVDYRMTANSGSACVKVGASLTVTFVSPGGMSQYGSWSDSAPTISDNSILKSVTYVPSGATATAVFNAVGTGTATVRAWFDVTCAPGDTTPCTVPPLTWETLTVTVNPA